MVFEPLKEIGWDGGFKLAESGGDDCVVLVNNGKTNPLYKIPSTTPLTPKHCEKLGILVRNDEKYALNGAENRLVYFPSRKDMIFTKKSLNLSTVGATTCRKIYKQLA